AAAAKPAVRVVALFRTCAPGGPFQHGCSHARDHRGVDRLPEHVAELIVTSQPQSATDLDRDDPELQCILIIPCPDAALVEANLMIDSKWSSTGRRSSTDPCQQQHRETQKTHPSSRSGIMSLSRDGRRAYSLQPTHWTSFT